MLIYDSKYNADLNRHTLESDHKNIYVMSNVTLWRLVSYKIKSIYFPLSILFCKNLYASYNPNVALESCIKTRQSKLCQNVRLMQALASFCTENVQSDISSKWCVTACSQLDWVQVKHPVHTHTSTPVLALARLMCTIMCTKSCGSIAEHDPLTALMAIDC
jgi:hypothetical protein